MEQGWGSYKTIPCFLVKNAFSLWRVFDAFLTPACSASILSISEIGFLWGYGNYSEPDLRETTPNRPVYILVLLFHLGVCIIQNLTGSVYDLQSNPDMGLSVPN